MGRILAFFFSADVGNGERLKQILYFIRDTYIALCVSVLCVRLFQIGSVGREGDGPRGGYCVRPGERGGDHRQELEVGCPLPPAPRGVPGRDGVA